MNATPGKNHWNTYRATHAHLDEQESLLEPRQAAQIHSRKTTDRHRADAIEQRIDIGDVKVGVGGIENPGAYQGSECTAFE